MGGGLSATSLYKVENMRKITLIFFLFAAILYSQEQNKYGIPKIVLTEYNPWAMVIGSDSPTFVLYDSGIIIYKDFDINDIVSVKINSEEMVDFIKSLNLSDSLFLLPNYFSASDWTDQPSNELVLNFDSLKTIYIYGSLRNESESREKTPTVLLDIFDKLINYNNNSADVWRPEKIEVMAWDYSYSPEEPVKWPDAWPDLNDKNTVDNDGLYSIYLDSKYFDDFLNLINNLGEKQAVEIDGKKFAVSYRFPFPNL